MEGQRALKTISAVLLYRCPESRPEKNGVKYNIIDLILALKLRIYL